MFGAIMHIPHDKLETGLYYLRVNYYPYYTVVSCTMYAIGPDAGKIGVWSFDQEGNRWPEDFAEDQFICKVPAPPLV